MTPYFVLSVLFGFVLFLFFSEDCKTQGTAFSTKVFNPKKYCFLFARFFMIADFKRGCALALLTRVLNVWFRPIIEFTYSYAIHGKITVRAISVVQEKFDVQFTRQAIHFSLQFSLKLV